MIDIKFKQFVIVPKNPKMSIGKVASQVAHSTFLSLENQKANHKLLGYDTRKKTLELIEQWKLNGMCVIVLECDNTTQLFGIAKYLEEWNVPHHLYIDEGLTEIPMGTPTSLATGVLTQEQFWMLGTLKLFTEEKVKEKKSIMQKLKRLFK